MEYVNRSLKTTTTVALQFQMTSGKILDHSSISLDYVQKTYISEDAFLQFQKAS